MQLLIGELACEVIATDDVSLTKERHIRFKMTGRDMATLRGFVEVFIEGVGYEIKFVPELNRKPTTFSKPPPWKKPDDDEFTDNDYADGPLEFEGEL